MPGRNTNGARLATCVRHAKDERRGNGARRDEEAMLRILYTRGTGELARVYIAELDDGSLIEFVESVQPPLRREEKWVLIVSTLKGCPVRCPICDAGGDYRGKLSADEILAQVDHMVRGRYPDGRVPAAKFKVQFARMGDPALNDAVLTALEKLPGRFEVPGLMPCISTVAPSGRERFFEGLLAIKREHYQGGKFQMQFSVHTTDEHARRRLVPVKTWTLEQMAEYGERFHESGDRKITLNFAPARGLPLEPKHLADIFSPERFLIKLTPINPTLSAARSGLTGLINPADNATCRRVADSFRAMGYDTILSIGELDENEIGSNCGMYVTSNARAYQTSDG